MSSQYDQLILDIEREIEELKTARQRVTAATSTLAQEITCQSKSTMNSSGNIIADTYAVITITPDGTDNNFLFTVSQEGVSGDGTETFDVSFRLGQTDGTYEARISTRSYNGTWNTNQQKTITHKVRIVATDTFTATVTEESA